MNGITEKVIQTEYVHEPTLYDVMDALGGLGGRMDGIESRLSVVELKLDAVIVRVDGMDIRLAATESRLFIVEMKIDDMQEDLHALARAVDTDAVLLVDQQRRLQNVERSILMD